MDFVYILRSQKNNRYYIGCTEDLVNRLQKHNNGYVLSTKAYRLWEMLYTETYNTLKEARHRERQLKSWKSRERLEKLIEKVNNGPIV